ncbi:MAG: glycogen synthase [Defluviitaleaceae bacterium]|nr:glycogen synthase [Defluviitaleaceae bacterium]
MNLKVLIAASEVAPYSKTGGLGDVMHILPQELRSQNVDARVVFPKYKSFSKFETVTQIRKFSIGIKWSHWDTQVFQVDEVEKGVYAIGNDHFFDRDNLYGYEDDSVRFYFFTMALFEMLKQIDFKPNLIHFNDWQLGLGSFYLKEAVVDDPFYKDIATVFSIHNIQHQGSFNPEVLDTLDISKYYFNHEMLEHYGKVSFMKAGIVYSDTITTVSKTYAKEIQTPNYSYGLDKVLTHRKDDLYGILNGISYDDISGGIPKDRDYLQERVGLPIKNVPVLALITRLVEQKGIDIIAVALDEILSHNLQLVVLGTGEDRYEKLFMDYSQRYENLASHIYFSTKLSIDIYMHSDMFLMPSLFEPCGLAQMIAMKYGTIPIVRKTGGLQDTIQHFDIETKTGNGFVFEDYDANGLMWAIEQALKIYREPAHWGLVAKNALNSKFTDENMAKEYIDLYENTIKKVKKAAKAKK